MSRYKKTKSLFIGMIFVILIIPITIYRHSAAFDDPHDSLRRKLKWIPIKIFHEFQTSRSATIFAVWKDNYGNELCYQSVDNYARYAEIGYVKLKENSIAIWFVVDYASHYICMVDEDQRYIETPNGVFMYDVTHREIVDYIKANIHNGKLTSEISII